MPVSGWLALASATIVIVFLIGNLLAQRSTQVTTQQVTHLERHFEPQVRLARDLERAISSFDRAVLGYLKFDTPMSDAGVSIASSELLMNLAQYERMEETPSQ